MLQQTQVATVLHFYPQFLAKFPTVDALAKAPLDDVLALWSGMGYYTRARNLHRAANQVMQDFGGEFPKTAEQLEQLVGVGRSTAAAIAAFCYGERVAILDGNVKRVLARVLAFNGDLAKTSEVNALWDKAMELLPTKNLKSSMPAYTQALMDMGATLCHVRSPDCISCPVASSCEANTHNAYEAYPVKTKKLKRSTESIWLLHATNAKGEVLLQKRPMDAVSKIWAGLYSLPPFESEAALLAALPQSAYQNMIFSPALKHALTHKDLWLHTAQVALPSAIKLTRLGSWYPYAAALAFGLPAPIRKILENHTH
ncbi:MAG: A/G-specific adenine glycosylase [Pseudomonadota bacterium]|jgi:A/G-specific adenine glycosylase